MINKEKRTIDLSFSSELPVERWWGMEILDHSAGSCDLSRLQNSAPLLMDHDQRMQIGVVEKAGVSDKRGQATVRFSQSPKAQEIFQDVLDGIRGKVSVGYSINKLVMETMDGDPEADDDSEATYRATSWTPYEVSLVSIPADDTVGVGRSIPSNQQTRAEIPITFSEKIMFKNNPILREPSANGDGNGTGDDGGDNHSAAILEAKNSEKNRQKEILAIGTRFRKVREANEAIESDMSVENFRAKILQLIEVPASHSVPFVPASQQDNARSVGEQFVDSAPFQRYLKSRVDKGERQPISFDTEFPIGEPGLRAWLARGAMLQRTTATSSGLTSIQKIQDVKDLGLVPMRVADLFMPGETAATTIRYIQENSFTNAATALAEEGTYQENVWSLTEVDAGVKKIGVIARVTDELMADYPAVRSYIDQRLSYGVGIKEDNHLINGSGINNQIKGILTFTGINTQAVGANTVVDACFKALVKVRTVGWTTPSAFIFNPADWSNIRLTKDTNGQYLYGGPSTGPYGVGPYMVSGFMWGLPVVETSSIAQGTALTGAFNLDAQIFRRIGLQVETTNSDASDFANGRVAIRVTERLALACYRPLSFCSITGIPAVP